MPVLKLNLGLNINGVPTLNAYPTLKAIKAHLETFVAGPSRYMFETAKSGETTLCAAVIIVPINAEELDRLIQDMCAEFQQDCIAGIYDNIGFLIGPKCEDYGGTFNITYWIEPPSLPAHALEVMELIECFEGLLERVVGWPYAEKEVQRQIDRVSIIRHRLKTVQR